MKQTTIRRAAMLTAALAISGAAHAQTIINSEDFEGDSYQGWLVNGNEVTFPFEGNPGTAMGVPLLDFQGISLRNETNAAVTGDMTRYGPFTVQADVRVLMLRNFFDEDMDPNIFPVVLEFIDYPDAGSSAPIASVYTIGRGMPRVNEQWVTIAYAVPDPTQAALPAGWGGTGDEDPVTFEPRLPVGRTYSNVLQNVDEVRMSTFVPGFFYVSAFWEVRFDNVVVRTGSTLPDPGCDSVDFNNDGVFPDDQDVTEFLFVLGGGDCPNCNDPDFNNDGVFPDDADLQEFLVVLGGGTC